MLALEPRPYIGEFGTRPTLRIAFLRGEALRVGVRIRDAQGHRSRADDRAHVLERLAGERHRLNALVGRRLPEDDAAPTTLCPGYAQTLLHAFQVLWVRPCHHNG